MNMTVKLRNAVIKQINSIAKMIDSVPNDADSDSPAYQDVKQAIIKWHLLEPLDLVDSRNYAEYFRNLAAQDIKSDSLNEAQGDLEASEEAIGSSSLYVSPSSDDCTADPKEDALAHLSDLKQWINDTIQMTKYLQTKD